MNPVWSASSAPRSVVRTPSTIAGVPSARPRASAIGMATRLGGGRRRRRSRWASAWARRSGRASGSASAWAVGVATGEGVGVGVGVADGVGDGVGGVRRRARGRVRSSAARRWGRAWASGRRGRRRRVGRRGDADGAGASASRWGPGTARITKSAALSFVSVPLPAAPPGRRSMLEPAAGAGAGAPSTKAFVASPHPTASIGVPPAGRRTTVPPVAAIPVVYVRSAIDAQTPGGVRDEDVAAGLDDRGRRPPGPAARRGPRGAGGGELEAREVHRHRPDVRDLDELVRRGRAAGLHLGDDERARARPCDGGGGPEVGCRRDSPTRGRARGRRRER